MRLCGAMQHPGDGGFRCTREWKHDGEHIAAIGPYAPNAPTLARWEQLPWCGGTGFIAIPPSSPGPPEGECCAGCPQCEEEPRG